jgi:hypothetical protein
MRVRWRRFMPIGRESPPPLCQFGHAQPRQTTFCHMGAEIGEAVDFVVHVERQSDRRIIREVLGLRRYERDTKLIRDSRGNMRQLRTQNETNIAATFPSDSTWNPGDFWLDISAPMPCFPRVQSWCESISASTRIRSMIGRGFCMRLPTEMGGGAVAKKTCSWGGVHCFSTGIEGVILHSISRWCRHGASHRKNFDTPPLLGCC